jgi:hypothetical protein
MVVSAGEFGQIHPLILQETTINELQACINSSHTWSEVQKCCL